jgi:hypothetical protein
MNRNLISKIDKAPAGVRSTPEANGSKVTAIRIDLRDHNNRLQQVAELYDQQVQTREERARIAVAAGIPGGDTGLFVQHARLVGSGDYKQLVKPFVIDVSFVRQMRTLLQTAHKLTRSKSVQVDKQSEETLRRRMAEGRKRLVEPMRCDPDEREAPPLPDEHGCESEALEHTKRSVLNIGQADVRLEEINDLYNRLKRASQARKNRIIGSRDPKQIAEECTVVVRELGALLEAAQAMEEADDSNRDATTSNAIAERLQAARDLQHRQTRKAA